VAHNCHGKRNSNPTAKRKILTAKRQRLEAKRITSQQKEYTGVYQLFSFFNIVAFPNHGDDYFTRDKAVHQAKTFTLAKIKHLINYTTNYNSKSSRTTPNFSP